MSFDATKLADWQISEEAEKNMPTPDEWVDRLGLEKEEMLPMGHITRLHSFPFRLSSLYPLRMICCV